MGKIKKKVKLRHLWRDAAIFLGCLAALILAGRYLVFSSIQIANYFRIPAYFIALTIIGIGTTLPDLAIEMKAVLRKHASLGLGDLLGSLTIELTFFLGILALIKPLQINLLQAWNAMLWLALAITFIMIVLKKKALTWKHGIALLGIFAAFMIIEIIKIA